MYVDTYLGIWIAGVTPKCRRCTMAQSRIRLELKFSITFHAAQTPIPHLRSARSLDYVNKAWHAEWTNEKRGRDLRILPPSPSPHTLRIHTQIRKGYSATITQTRTGKIGLRHFMCLRGVPGFNDPWCTCRNDNQAVRHVLQD